MSTLLMGAGRELYRVVCVVRETLDDPHRHQHIAGVGALPWGSAELHRWSVDEVIEQIEDGTAVYTRSPTTGAFAIVRPGMCPFCSAPALRSVGDVIADNDIKNLSLCPAEEGDPSSATA